MINRLDLNDPFLSNPFWTGENLPKESELLYYKSRIYIVKYISKEGCVLSDSSGREQYVWAAQFPDDFITLTKEFVHFLYLTQDIRTDEYTKISFFHALKDIL